MLKPSTPPYALGVFIAVASVCFGLLSACGVRETAQSLAAEASQSTTPTVSLVPYEATQEARRATSMARVANDIATSEAMPSPAVHPTVIIPTRAPDPGPFGIVPCEAVSWDTVLIENCWVGLQQGVRIGVRAGALKTDTQQGALQIRDQPYLTPTRSGAAQIVKADGLVLTVQTADGSFFGFDVATLQWTNPQPTATPRAPESYPSGIVACTNVPASFLAANCWSQLLGDLFYEVQAGAFANEPMKGYLIVRCQNIQPGGSVCEPAPYQTPSDAGRIEIIAVDGLLLTLRGEDGTFFGFNVETSQWVTPPATPTPVSATATPTATPTNTPSPTPAVTNAAVRPVLECVVDQGGGAYTAYFGYKNDNTSESSILVGANNRFSPTPQDRGQPTTFLPGRQQRVFAVAFNGSNLVWTLKGPDGRGRTATASSGSARCTTP